MCAWIIVLTMAVCIALGLITGRTVDVYKSRYATAGFTCNPAVASCLLLSTLPVFIRLISYGGSAIVVIILFFTSRFFTMRRSALISGVVATCCCLATYLTSLRCRVAWRAILALISVVIVLVGLMYGTSSGPDLMGRFKDFNPSKGTGSGRYIFWRISLEHIINRPVRAQLLGEGIGSIRDSVRQRFGVSVGSHNDWFDVVHALGLSGLIGIAWWYFELARLVWCLHQRHDDLFQGACAFVIILSLMSIGTGGSFDPSWALSYAAIGFWSGLPTRAKLRCDTQID